MGNKEKNIEEKEIEEAKIGSDQISEKEPEKLHSNFLKSFLDGSLLSREVILKQFRFVLFLSFIAIILIANRYGAEKVVRKTQTLENELKELKAEQISITSELMQLSQQSEVAKLVNFNELGLSESVEPPKKIIVNKGK